MRQIGPPELGLGALALVLLGASVVGVLRDDGGASDATPGAGDVAVIDFDFDPNPVRTEVGQPLTWTNEDSAPHTVTSDGEGPLGSDELAQGESYEATFDTAGTYEYICTIHPTMRGTVVVSS